ncbi:MAG: conserved protein of unknown function [Nitrospira sp.]
MRAIVLVNCTPFHLTDMRSTSTPKPKSLDVAELARSPILVFPTEASPTLQGYSLAVSQALSTALSQVSPPFQDIPQHESLNRINDHGLAQDYTEMVSEFSRSGVFDRSRLEKLGSALGLQYLFQPGIGDFAETLADRLMLGGWRLVKTRAATLRLWLRLWDMKSGHILWEATGEATVTNGNPTTGGGSMEAY